MAQQTINVGTAPNDGTGTPLRTAFQYTNSNFSELYTAVGPSGNNIVVPGSATITGDLTVKTNVLKVDTTNNRVGIGTASPHEILTVANTGGNVIQSILTSAAGTANIFFATSTTGVNSYRGYLQYDQSLNSLAFGINSTTAMTLNSTGLGVGVSPDFKFAVNGTQAVPDTTGSSTTNGSLRIGAPGTGLVIDTGVTAATDVYGWIQARSRTNYANNYNLVLQPNGGNLGIGVTPSAWWSSTKALQISSSCSLVARTDTASRNYLASNAYLNSTPSWTYLASNTAAARYDQNDGSHQWHIAPSSGVGGAGNAITFTQAMTLDASGNLLVGKSVSLFSTVGVEASGTGFISATNSASTNATTNLSVYSTGAAAFRFYVGLGGTVFATNTTISAISDARLKENVQDLDVGLGAILALKPRKFDWKAGKGKDIKGDRGFIAQEFEQVFPQLVDEWKDEAPEGEAPYKSVRQDLIPVLVKAIQELAAEVNALKNA